MRSLYHPNPAEQEPHAERNVLLLGARRDVLLVESTVARAHARLFASPQVKGWLARIDGVGANWSLERFFCRGEWRDDDDVRYLDFTLKEGLYEAECTLYSPVVETSGAHRLYFTYRAHRGIVLLTRAQFEARVRLFSEVTFGDVRGLAAQHKWNEAERAARLIEDAVQRDAAVNYVAQQHERWEQGLPELEGSDKQIIWASSLRQTALTALRDYGARFSTGQGPARQELDRALDWLMGHHAARFWIDHRDHLEGSQLWELYLKVQVEQ